jgi:DNA polymerase-3 subunit chi
LAEVWFYRLAAAPPEAALPELLEKSLARGWRVLVRVDSPASVAALDEALWTYRDDAFLPHGRADAPGAARQPVLISSGPGNPNGAQALMLAHGGRAEVEELARFERTCLIFDGEDPAALDAARARWRDVRGAGLPARYWAREAGRWVEKAAG